MPKRPSSVMLRVHPDFAKLVRRTARLLSREERTTVSAPEVTRRMVATDPNKRLVIVDDDAPEAPHAPAVAPHAPPAAPKPPAGSQPPASPAGAL